MRQSSVLAPRNLTQAGYTRSRAALIFTPEKGGTLTETRLAAKKPTPAVAVPDGMDQPKAQIVQRAAGADARQGREAGESRASVLPPREKLRDAYMRTGWGGGRCGDRRQSFQRMTASDAIRMGAWGKREREGGDGGREQERAKTHPGCKTGLGQLHADFDGIQWLAA